MKAGAVVLGAVLLACQGLALAQRQPGASIEYRASSHVQQAAKAAAPELVQSKGRGEPTSMVKLAPPTGDELAQLSNASKDARASRIGFARPVHGGEQLLARLHWQDLEGGARVAHFAVSSPDAAALRVGILVKALPLQSIFRFHDGSGRAFEVTGGDILETIANNLDAREDGADARTYWSPVIESSIAVVEIELPFGARAADLHMSVPRISHLVSSAKKGFTVPKVGTSCAIDAKCHEGMWANEMNAEARVLFTRGGVTYACSGTLLADQDPATEIPYFHTASHCIASQSDASTIATYWFYRSNACNSAVPGRYEVRNGGAALLQVHAETDTTLLRLESTPPEGAVYMGWSAGTPLATGAAVTGIHHGNAEVQKISFGDVNAYGSCLLNGGMCRSASMAEGNYYYVTWRAGATLGGSSGSPLVAGNSRKLVGHLSSGMSSCGGNAGDFYGRFDVAYRAGLDKWLGSTPVSVVLTPPPGPREVTGRLRLTRTFRTNRSEGWVDP